MEGTHEEIRDDNLVKIRFSVIEVFNELFHAHWHNHLEIIYLLEGHMTAYVNEVSYELTTEDILLINPQNVHYTHSHGRCVYLLIQIPALHLERLCTEWRKLLFLEYYPYSCQKESLNRRMAALFAEMTQIDSQKNNGYHLLLLQKLYELLYLLYTEGSFLIGKKSRNRTERDSRRMEQCMKFVLKNYSRPISLAEIANLLSISPEYFCRLFREHTGQTFLEYVNQVRMTHMYQDILQTDESITFLLDKNGITNYKSFLQNFKKTYGTTPQKVRQKARTQK